MLGHFTTLLMPLDPFGSSAREHVMRYRTECLARTWRYLLGQMQPRATAKVQHDYWALLINAGIVVQ